MGRFRFGYSVLLRKSPHPVEFIEDRSKRRMGLGAGGFVECEVGPGPLGSEPLVGQFRSERLGCCVVSELEGAGCVVVHGELRGGQVRLCLVDHEV